MERHPILTEEESVAIKMIQNPLTFRDLIPDYSFQFETGEVSEEAVQMYEEFLQFLQTNEELSIQESDFISRDDYVKGFKRAVAMMRLWIDSIYRV